MAERIEQDNALAIEEAGRKLVAHTLVSHGVKIRLLGGRLQAFEVISGPSGEDCSKWADVHDFGPQELLDWLGY